MTSHNFDQKLTPLPLGHPKMVVLPTPSYRVKQKYVPPSLTCVTSFMNALRALREGRL